MLEKRTTYRISNAFETYPFSDWLLCISITAGLIWSPALIGILLAAILHKPSFSLAWERHHTYLLIAAIIGLFIILFRDKGDSLKLILRFAFLWILPFVILVYRPDERTINLFCKFIYIIFLIDFIFNIGGALIGDDLLGRQIDLRDGLLSARMGGVFAHSFYSGSISITAMTALLSSRHAKVWATLPAINLLLAGSWRLGISIFLILIFLIWKNRSYIQEILMVIALSFIAVMTTIYTSNPNENYLNIINPANTLRVYAWVTAIEKISNSPLIGVGYPNENVSDGVSYEIIDESLISESWYLGSAITFGIPYTLIRFSGFLILFFNRRHTLFGRINSPLILVDMVYGGFFEGIVFYSMLWIQMTASSSKRYK